MTEHNSHYVAQIKGTFYGTTLTFGAWTSGGVDMAPKRSSSTGWMSKRNRNILYLSSYYKSVELHVMSSCKHNRAEVLTGADFTWASPPFCKTKVKEG